MTDDLLRATVSVRGVISDTRGHVLTVQRRTDHEWELPGGRLNAGESPQQGLRREVHEETKLDVEIVDIVKANSWVNTAGEDRFAVHYHCEPTAESVVLSEEHVDSAWVRSEVAAQVLTEAQVTAVQMALAETEASMDLTGGSSHPQD